MTKPASVSIFCAWAMVAVGLWGAFLGSPAIVLLPVIFPLVMAFGGESLIRDAYAQAVQRGYRFYSFGDAMAIL